MSFYNTGTASIAQGETAVTGQGTSWQTAGLPVQAGDLFWAAGVAVPIASVNGNTSLTLTDPWPGTTRTAQGYKILYRSDADRLVASMKLFSEAVASSAVSALKGLTPAADRLPYFTGVNSGALATFTSQARQLLDDTTFDAMLATLGGGAIGRAAFKAATRGTFLMGAGITYDLSNVADDAVVSVDIGTGFEAALVAVMGNTPAYSGIYAVRTHTSSNGASKFASIGVTNAYSNALTGITGADNSLNIGAGNDGRLYIENRTGAVLGIFVHVLKRS